MHKISNFTGSAKHGWERMTPSMGFGMSRPQQQNPQQQHHGQPSPHDLASNGGKRGMPGPSVGGMPPNPGHPIHLSFNIPFNSNLPGPDAEDILYSSTGAEQRWLHHHEQKARPGFPNHNNNNNGSLNGMAGGPGAHLTAHGDGILNGGGGEPLPNHALPIHTRNVENLRALCQHLSELSGDRVRATVTSAKPKPVPGMQRGPLTALVTNVCISGDAEAVHKIRAKILNETPITLVSLPLG